MATPATATHIIQIIKDGAIIAEALASGKGNALRSALANREDAHKAGATIHVSPLDFDGEIEA
jgi:hypothetical protein